MYLARINYYPRGDAADDLLTTLKEFAGKRNAQGVRTNLLRRWAGPDLPHFQVVTFHDTLQVMADRRTKLVADAAMAGLMKKASSLTRATGGVDIWEMLLDPQNPPTDPGTFTVRFSWHAMPGRLGDLVGLAVETTKALQAQGYNGGVVASQFAPEGATVQSLFFIKKLGDWDVQWPKLRADPKVMSFARLAGAMCARPVGTEVWEFVTVAPRT